MAMISFPPSDSRDRYAQAILKHYFDRLSVPSIEHVKNEPTTVSSSQFRLTPRIALTPIPVTVEVPALDPRPVRQDNNKLRIGILGAGAAGLFTGMILEKYIREVNKRHKAGDLKIEFEILEAEESPGADGKDGSNGHRYGGRLWTHSLGGTDYDYYVRLVLCSSPVTAS